MESDSMWASVVEIIETAFCRSFTCLIDLLEAVRHPSMPEMMDFLIEAWLMRSPVSCLVVSQTVRVRARRDWL